VIELQNIENGKADVVVRTQSNTAVNVMVRKP